MDPTSTQSGPSSDSPVGRWIPNNQQQEQQQAQQQQQQHSPGARRLRVWRATPPSVTFRFRSGFRGLSRLEEDEQTTPEQNIVTRSLFQERSSSLSGNKRELSLYEHLDLTDPRTPKRPRPTTQVVAHQQSNTGERGFEAGGQSSDNQGQAAMRQFSEKLQEKLSEVECQVTQLAHKLKDETIQSLQQRVGELEQEVAKKSLKLMQYKSAYEESVKCQICFERNRHIVLMPCMHFMYCGECIRQHRQAGGSLCPYCRTGLQGELAVNMMNEIVSPSTSQQ